MLLSMLLWRVRLFCANSFSFMERLITWAINPFLNLYTDAPALIFLSSATYSVMKFNKILSLRILAFNLDPSG